MGLIGIYELNRVELLRDVFVWAYERSSRRYQDCPRFASGARSIPSQIPYCPHGGRRRGCPTAPSPTMCALTDLSQPLVPAEDLGRFTQLALTELKGLHEGNIARFRLRPSRVSAVDRQVRAAWKPVEELQAAARSPE